MTTSSAQPTRNGLRVLVVDDDPQIRGVLRRTYETAGWLVDEADGGRDALRMLYESRPDAVLLDLVMSDLDGWATIQRIRDLSDIPVLVLSGCGGELDKVRALSNGADDYVVKPFGRMELLARTQAVLRRAGAGPACDAVHDDGILCVDFARGTVHVGEREVTLTPLEFRLLAAFVRHTGHVLSWEQLIELAWRENAGTRDQVKVYVGYLRRKLGDAGDSVETVRGFGYRYRPRAGRAAQS